MYNVRHSAAMSDIMSDVRYNVRHSGAMSDIMSDIIPDVRHSAANCLWTSRVVRVTCLWACSGDVFCIHGFVWMRVPFLDMRGHHDYVCW